MRSWLFVPGDSEKKLAKSLTTNADALIIDLEDSVSAGDKQTAREITSAFTKTEGNDGPSLWIRINALDTGLTDEDLEAVMDSRPAGIMLPKALSGSDITHLDAKLTALEAIHGLDDGATRIGTVATETAASLFTIGTYAGCSPRLEVLTWGAEDLSADIGAETSRTPDNTLTGPYELARTLSLLGAVAAGVQPLDTVFVNFRDNDGLRAECEAAVRDGFTGKMAIHPAQVDIINEAFTPSDETVSRAQAVLRAFADAGDAGVVAIDGEMLDRPHQRRAEKVIKRARLAGKT